MPKIIEVIQHEISRGKGNDFKDPFRVVQQYFLPDGTFLAENDPCSDPTLEFHLEENKLFIRSPVDNKFIAITAIIDSVAAANQYLAKHLDESVIADLPGHIIIISRNKDLGIEGDL